MCGHRLIPRMMSCISFLLTNQFNAKGILSIVQIQVLGMQTQPKIQRLSWKLCPRLVGMLTWGTGQYSAQFEQKSDNHLSAVPFPIAPTYCARHTHCSNRSISRYLKHSCKLPHKKQSTLEVHEVCTILFHFRGGRTQNGEDDRSILKVPSFEREHISDRVLTKFVYHVYLRSCCKISDMHQDKVSCLQHGLAPCTNEAHILFYCTLSLAQKAGTIITHRVYKCKFASCYCNNSSLIPFLVPHGLKTSPSLISIH